MWLQRGTETHLSQRLVTGMLNVLGSDVHDVTIAYSTPCGVHEGVQIGLEHVVTRVLQPDTALPHYAKIDRPAPEDVLERLKLHQRCGWRVVV